MTRFDPIEVQMVSENDASFFPHARSECYQGGRVHVKSCRLVESYESDGDGGGGGDQKSSSSSSPLSHNPAAFGP